MSTELQATVRAQRRAFTLIELLVVIAMIAILAAITLPMVPGVNDQARVETCESRLQQVGIALRQYAEDYHAYPRSLEALYQSGYVEQEAVLHCSKTGEGFFYRPTSLTAPREAIVAACADPSGPAGARPHRHGTMAVELQVNGSTTHTH